MNLGSDLPRPYTRRKAASAPATRSRAPQQFAYAAKREVRARSIASPNGCTTLAFCMPPTLCSTASVHILEAGRPTASCAQVFTRRGFREDALVQPAPAARLPSAFFATDRDSSRTSSLKWGAPSVPAAASPGLTQYNLELRVLGRPGTAAASGLARTRHSNRDALPTRLAHGRGPVLASGAARTTISQPFGFTLPR